MSIREWIRGLIDDADKRLYVVNPPFPSEPALRTLLVSPEIHTLITGQQWPNADWTRRCNALRADLESFVVGNYIGVSLTPREAGSAYMGLLAPEADGTWDIRSRDPSPGIRLLGRFAERDTFIALIPASRSVHSELMVRGPLGAFGSEEWNAAIKECNAEWRKLFPTYGPITGGNAGDFLSAKYHVL